MSGEDTGAGRQGFQTIKRFCQHKQKRLLSFLNARKPTVQSIESIGTNQHLKIRGRRFYFQSGLPPSDPSAAPAFSSFIRLNIQTVYRSPGFRIVWHTIRKPGLTGDVFSRRGPAPRRQITS